MRWSLRSYLLLLVFLAGGTGVLFVTAFANESSRVEERGTVVSEARIDLQKWGGFKRSVERLMVTLDLLVGSGVTYLGEDAKQEILHLQEELTRFEKRPAFDTISGDLVVMKGLLVGLQSIIRGAIQGHSP